MRTFIRRLDQFEATPIGEAGTSDAPAFSPDGEWLAYCVGATLMKVPVAGGPSQKLAELAAPSRGLHWTTNGTILVGVPLAGLVSVPEEGGEVRVLTTISDGRQLWYPHALPGGRGTLITASEAAAGTATVELLLPGTGERRTLLPGAAGRYLASGHLVFVRANALWAVPFDLDSLEVRGTPVPVVDGVRVEGGGAVQYAASDAGAIVYVPGTAGTVVRAFWLSRSGQEEPIDVPPREYRYPRVSPDGTRIVIEGRDDETDIWILTLGRRTPFRLTAAPTVEFNAQWSADSRRVIFVSDRERPPALFEKAADGTGTERLIVKHTGPLSQPLLSPDSAYVIARAVAGGNEDLVAIQLGDKPTVRPLVATRFRERNADLSRNGRWLAYQSDESGVDEVYVQPFPSVETARWPISENGGTRPLWSKDGRELFYLATDGWLMSVRVGEAPTFSYGKPARVVDLSRYPDNLIGRNFDLSPDGSRFFVLRPDMPTQRAEIKIVLNWFGELTRRVPVN